MKSLFAIVIWATVLTPVVTSWIPRIRASVLEALQVRAEVSEIMAEAYRRQR
ncbi:hypothetical protein [Caballeronia humi]|jgi:hypothetical protein|uniref:Uncharacterized protein n=1 Tax=Caballeronia humi TaxID=326474 RepID=A0A158GMR0_9BURK|nr:hypothetical protein [Caballeronia humi]SAL33213.1 hypothetical protein AWB65_02228 [Caballeronia humi]